MRRGHHLLIAEQNVGLGGLFLEHVEGGAREMAGIERRLQRRLVDQSAARAIDDARAFLHLADGVGGDDVPRLVGERRMQRDEIGARQQIVQLDFLDAEIGGALGARDRDRRR